MTVLVGAVLVGLLLAGLLSAPVPYVILGAGPTVDTVGTEKGKQVINVTGRATSDSAGQLRLTTVGVQGRTDLVAAIAAWFDRSEAVVPRELIYPPGRNEKEVDKQNQEEFARSQTSAETAALRHLGFPVRIRVSRIVPGGAAEGVLRADDVVTGVDGKKIDSGAALTAAIQAAPAGTRFRVAYERAGKPAAAALVSRGAGDDPPRIGVEIEQEQPHPFQLKIDVPEEIGGPSAGLMFALGIIDKLTPEDLTGGKVIAGTGTIDDAGKVGPIGGIPQKLVGARAAGATYFLAPADNCAEAAANPVAGLTLARVSTLDEALAALADIRAGRPPKPC
ncbi:hypothetical protein GCM10010123_33550 [Pilimelia anulata]|uniref:endopeptidase La n=1 Tax=Pilimelia anulata TaxID=53371 RepID=A0A8J3B7B9_9ACTN|nr:hypothetical protein GCM10010123_33550 [Pilimelia anulata]